MIDDDDERDSDWGSWSVLLGRAVQRPLAA